MTIHTETCDNCDKTFAYDAPPTPEVTPEYCSSGCQWADVS